MSCLKAGSSTSGALNIGDIIATVIEELLMQIGIDVDDKSIEQFNKVTDATIKTLKRVTIAAGAAGAAIVAYTVKMAGATDENAKFSEQTGVAFETLQELGFAAEHEGANLDSMKSSLAGLTRTVGEASIGMGSGIEAFARLEMNIRDANGEIKTADVLLSEVSDGLQGYSRAEQTDLISKLGISPDVLLLLQRGTKNLMNLRLEARKYGNETERMAKSGQDFQDNTTRLSQSIRGALIPLRQFIIDLANNLLPKITEWIANNKKLIKSKFVEYLQDIIKWFKDLIKVFKKLIPLIKALTIGFATFQALSYAKSIFIVGKAIWALVPAITAATGGLNLIIPLIALVAGGLAAWFSESEMGSDVFGFAMERIGNSLKKLDKAFTKFLNSFGISGEDMGEIWEKHIKPFFEEFIAFGLIVVIELLAGAIDTVALAFEGWGLIIEGVVDGVKDLVKWLDKLDVRKEAGSFSAKISKGLVRVKESFGFGNQSQATPTPRASTTGGGNTSNSNTISANIEISSASGDPNTIGMAVKEALISVARNGMENQTVTVIA